jgi:hypothetical protein
MNRVNQTTLLAGPILRRVDSSGVSIWLASRQPIDAQVEIFRFKDLKQSEANNPRGSRTPEPIGTGYAKSVRLGKNLNIDLVTAKPIADAPQSITNTKKETFPEDELLAYDVKINRQDANMKNNGSVSSQRLNDLGLLSGVHSIVYNNEANNKKLHNFTLLPTFFISSKDEPLNLLHASCRKLHGKGADSLVAADKILSDHFDNLKKRPSALFLTGDQIYADDVAGPLIKHISKLGNDLLGWTETIDGLGKPPSQLKIDERQSIIQEHAKFTATNAGNHLLGFGEFAAVYLMAWNINNWPNSYPDAKREVSWSKRSKYFNQVKQLKEEWRVLPLIRRILANIPTYMICDDHDITDDWNITEEWTRNVNNSRMGKQVIANGLTAYWAFQAWGNAPDQFGDKFIAGITNYLDKGENTTSADRKKFKEQMLDFHNWSYSVPVKPLTVVLDSRTQRQYDSLAGPPQLVNDEALFSFAKIARNSGYLRGEPLVIVTPTPVFGFEYAEEVQQLLARRSGRVYKLDLETWSANVKGWIKFLSFLSEELAPSTCIFLSGDVHYAFSLKATFHIRRKKGTSFDSMNIVQLNSSAIKTTGIVKIALLSEILGRLGQISTTKYHIRMGWNVVATTPSPPNSFEYDIAKLTITRNDGITSKAKSNQKTLRLLSRYGQPDWIISTSMVNASGAIFPLLVIADNNIGLATISTSLSSSSVVKPYAINHELLVRKKAQHYDKVHRAILDTNDIDIPATIQGLFQDRKRSEAF